MATAIHVSPLPTPSTSQPPTPPYPAFPRLPGSPSIQRNGSSSSSRSNTTTSSTSSSLVATPIRPPPIETRTAATSSSQLPSRPSSRGEGNGDEPGGSYGGRGFTRNGPRSRQGSLPLPSNITTSPSPPDTATPNRTASVPLPLRTVSPTTPRPPRFPITEAVADSAGPLRVNGSMDPMDPGPSRGRKAPKSFPSSSVGVTGNGGQQRALSVDRQEPVERERRQSQASAQSSGSASGQKKPSLRDYVLGEELGRGSYSTVVQASAVSSASSLTSPGPPREYAIKIINQAHLVQERKVKYAMIERDALVRLNDIRKTSSPTTRRHRRGMSNSSTASAAGVSGATKTRSNTSMTSASTVTVQANMSKDRLSVISDSSSSTTTLGSSVPLSPTLKSSLAGRRPSRSAEPPEMVPERSEEPGLENLPDAILSKPPSPVKEEDKTPPRPTPANMADPSTPIMPDSIGSPRGQTPKKPRRQSLALSERSVKSTKASPVAHPGIIRLYSTFNDATSLYFVLDLARNGELLGFIRKHGSLDLASARYYAAQLVDTLEFMHERGVIHRDLKPENILLDEDMRVKVTDFGSAKLMDRDGGSVMGEEGKKRSFVGSADFVSPEVLRNEPAVLASDIWAFGCILYQLLVGRPPFRGATDYLTFQKILKREMEYPEGFDEDARELVEVILNLDPVQRPLPSEIKSHSFFCTIDFPTLWSEHAPNMYTGLMKPVASLANADPDTDIWAVFEDEVSDGGFEYDDVQPEGEADHRHSPQFDRDAAAHAVRHVDQGSFRSLEPPRPAFAVTPSQRTRGWSSGSRSARTSSSSSNNRTALTGLLETMGMMGNGLSTRGGSGTASRTSNRSDESRMKESKSYQTQSDENSRWTPLLLANERITFTSPISIRPPSSIPIPSFLLPAPKRRQLILTDFPRLISVSMRDDDPSQLKVKSEYVFVLRPNSDTAGSVASLQGGAAGTAAVPNRVLDVQEKGPKGFVVQTASGSHTYLADTAELRVQWVRAMKRVVG